MSRSPPKSSYILVTVPLSDNIDHEEALDYFLADQPEHLRPVFKQHGLSPQKFPNGSLLTDDNPDAGIIEYKYRSRVCYVGFVRRTESEEGCMIVAMLPAARNQSDMTILESQYVYLEFLRLCRMYNHMDVHSAFKGLVRNPANNVPRGVYEIVQHGKMVVKEHVTERQRQGNEAITYIAYEIGSSDGIMLDPVDMYCTEDHYSDTWFRIDPDEIFELCKKEISSHWVLPSIKPPVKQSRVLVVFGIDIQRQMRGVRVVVISKDTRNILHYWGKFACAKNLGMHIQRKSLDIMRNELAHLMTTMQGEMVSDNMGRVRKKRQSATSARFMHFKAIKSAISFWEYMGYTMYRMNKDGEGFFKAAIHPEDRASPTSPPMAKPKRARVSRVVQHGSPKPPGVTRS